MTREMSTTEGISACAIIISIWCLERALGTGLLASQLHLLRVIYIYLLWSILSDSVAIVLALS